MAEPFSKAPRTPPWRALSTPGTSAPDPLISLSLGDCDLARQVPGASERAPHVGTVEVFRRPHERQEKGQDSRPQVVGQVLAAGAHARADCPLGRQRFQIFPFAFLPGVYLRRIP